MRKDARRSSLSEVVARIGTEKKERAELMSEPEA
jgi:hypothetical protein